MKIFLFACAALMLPVAAHAAAFPPNCNPSPTAGDDTTDFCTTEYFPDPSRSLQPNAAAALGHNLPNVGLTNLTDYVFGQSAAGSNVRSFQDVLNTFFTRPLSGETIDPSQAAPNVAPADTAGDSFQFGVYRTFPMGSRNQNLLVTANGLHFKSICSNNRTNCTQGNIWSGMIRPQFVFLPNQTLKFVFTSPPGCKEWFAMWEFSGEETSGFNTGPNQIYSSVNGLSYEFDTPDNFTTCYAYPATAAGHGIIDGFPYEANGISYSTYWPSGNGWIYHNGQGEEPYLETPPQLAINAGRHEYVVSWDNTVPTQSIISSFLDGRLIHQHLFDWSLNAGNPTPNGQPLGLVVMVSQQSFPSFAQAGEPLQQSDLGDGVLYELAQFSGFISQATALNYAPPGTINGCGGECP